MKNKPGAEVLTPAEQLEQAFNELYMQYCGDMTLTAKKANIIDSFWSQIGNSLFLGTPENMKFNHQKSKLIYSDVVQMEELVNKYVELCQRYGCVPKIHSFAELTKIDKQTFHNWHNANTGTGYIVKLNNEEIEREKPNIYIIQDGKYEKLDYIKASAEEREINSLRFDILQKLRDSAREFTRNAVMDSNIGPAAMANNDAEVGLMWDAKRQITAEAIKSGAVQLDSADIKLLQ